ncbi:endo alpha-1,4 polygalactosaminidase [Streptomyces sp. NPDC057020]|uniref:endo alpha-1,4 polygalactosaminidase n=1 Tax=unclassified Streptomyces TaxID=2593676 RepID=UPI003627FEE9
MPKHAPTPFRHRKSTRAALAAGVVAALGAGVLFTQANASSGDTRPRTARNATTPATAESTPPAGPTTAPRPTAPAKAKPTTAPKPTTTRRAATTPKATTAPKATAPPGPTTAKVTPPTANAPFDYQIGSPYSPPKNVQVVSRDRTAKPAAGLYTICYVNAFQTQPDALDWWEKNHRDLLLRDGSGTPVQDEDWGEVLLDTSTAGKRERLAKIVGGWIDGCAKSGFQAVEPDNLDSYERSGDRLTKQHNAAFARLLAQRAHAAGLAIGQKNTTELLPERRTIGFDFAVAEECGQYEECEAYAAAYANRVYVIEYTDTGYSRACSGWGGRLSVVQRDLDVSAPGGSYRYRAC